MSFTTQQPKEKGFKPELPLVFIDSVHFLNNSLDNLIKNLGESDFYHLSQEFNTNAFTSEKRIPRPPTTTEIALKKSKKAYLVKLVFVIH